MYVKSIPPHQGSLKKCFIVIHGSAGLGSDTDRFFKFCREHNYTVFYIEHFLLRKMDKNLYSPHDLKRINYFDFVQDWENFLSKQFFQTYEEVNLLGFSLGANAALLLNSKNIHRCFAFYPSYLPSSRSLINSHSENAVFFFGDKDIWTPPSSLTYFQREGKVSGQTFVFKNTYHGFFKKSYHAEIEVLPLKNISSLKALVLEDDEYKEQFQWPNPFTKQLLFPQKENIIVKSSEVASRMALQIISKELNLL